MANQACTCLFGQNMHDRAQSCAIALRSPAFERTSDFNRCLPDIHARPIPLTSEHTEPVFCESAKGMLAPVARALSLSLISQTLSHVQAGTEALAHSGSQHRHAYPWLSDEKQTADGCKVRAATRQRRREHRNFAATARNVRAWHLRGDLRQRWHPRLEYAHDGTVLQLDWSAHRGEPGHLHKASLQSQRSATMVNAPSCPNGQAVQMSRAGGAVAAVVDFASQSYMAKWGRHMGATGTNQEMRDINARRWARTCALPLARCAGCRRSRAAHYRHPQLLDGTRGGGGDRDGKNRRVHDLLLSHSFR